MRKRLCIISLLVWLVADVFAQNQIGQYEYWFDDNVATKNFNPITPVSSFQLNTAVLTTGLPAGLHTFQIRFKETTGEWSSPTTQFFVKQPNNAINEAKVVKYEYWFDTDYTKKTVQTVSSQNNLSVVSSIATNSLPVGLHTFQIRFQEATGEWTFTTTQFFVKQPNNASKEVKVVKYEYWFDTDYTKKTVQTVSTQNNLSLVSSIPTNSLPVGLHTFQIRFQEATGAWSSTTTQFFVKQPNNASNDAKVVKYEYWFDTDYSKKTIQSISSQKDLSLVSSIPTNSLPVGLHTFRIRFQEATGAWSSTTTQFFVKPSMYNMGDNKILSYEYWFNDSINRRTRVDVDPVNPLDLKNIFLPVNSLTTHVTPTNIRVIKDSNGNSQFATTNRFYIRFKDARGAWSAVNDTTFSAIIDDVDLTSFIINPDASENDLGWTTNGPIGSLIQNTTHWSGKINPYFCLGNSAITGWTSGMSQTVSGLPAGTYTLSASGRAALETTMTMTAGGVSVDFPAYGNVGGEIWEDALAGSPEKKCNNGAGFGWSKRNLTFTTDGSPFVIQVNGIATKSGQWFDIDEFTLCVNNAASLDVSFPDNVTAANYKGCNLQLTNKKTNAKISQTTSSNKTYTFSGLIPTNYYNVALLTTKGVVIGGIDSIKLNRGSNTLKFSTLKTIVPVTLQVITPGKKNVTENVVIQWYNAEKQFLLQGDTLSEMTAGTLVTYSITPNKEIGSQYKIPEMQTYTVKTGTNNISYTLQKIDSVTVSGTLKDENKWAIAGGSVAVIQLLNGKYAKNFTSLTDKQGKYSLVVLNDSTTITLSYPGYINQTRSYSNFNDSTNLGTTILQPITGLTVTTIFNYTSSVAEGETASTDSYYSNYQNIDYQLYNLTKGKVINKFNVQYPNLIIQDTTSVNDQIRITAISKTSDFNPVSSVIIVNQSNKDTVNFNLKELGAIKATYSGSSNSSNTGILYNSQGKLVIKDTYSSGSLTFRNLTDGTYSLVSIAGSTYFSAVSDLSDFSASGLKEGSDYLLNRVQVISGIITNVSVSSIPALDLTKFYYTGTNTAFTVNKTLVTAGNYVTLRAKIDYKGEYAKKVSNVSLIVDIPDSCSFVKNSVMIGTNLAAYVQEGNRITIPLNGNYSDIVRLCITPTVGGKYYPTAFVKFDYNKKTITQPIGSASFTSEDMSITVPEQTANKAISVSGTAPAFSTVSIYDGTTVIGQTTAYATGIWLTSCDLYEAYNLTTHSISAHIQTPAGVTILTETKKVEYNISLVEVKTVSMINTAHGPASLSLKEYNTVFDFQHPSATMPPYWYWPNYSDFTFKIDFTNNDTAYVSNVTLYVKTSSNEIVPLAASYDKKKDVWVATQKFTSNSLPVNVSVRYKAKSDILIDKTKYIHNNTEFKNFIENNNNIISEINKAFTTGSDSIFNSIFKELGITIENKVDNTLQNKLNSMTKTEFEQYINSESKVFADSISTDYGGLNNIIFNEKYFDRFLNSGTQLICKSTDNINENGLINFGFSKIKTTDNNFIYIKNDSIKSTYVDFADSIYYEIIYPKQKFSIRTKIKSTIQNDSFSDKLSECLKIIDEATNKIKKISESTKNGILVSIVKFEADAKFLNMQYAFKKQVLINIQNAKTPDPILIEKWTKEVSNAERILAINKQTIDILRKCIPLIDKAIPVFNLIDYGSKTATQLHGLYTIGIKIYPCPDDKSNADACAAKTLALMGTASFYFANKVAFEVMADGSAATELVASVPTGGVSTVGALFTLLSKDALSEFIDRVYIKLTDMATNQLIENVNLLDCNDCKKHNTCPCEVLGTCPPPPGGGGGGGGDGGGTPSGSGDVPHQMDPSGYVYEAVSSNRLEGVTATIYNKTNEEDMYGDTHEVITKWDAAPYLQVNPQITDENGVYAWDVSDGMWQVKYEKAGYETVYSSWLPVPPPQLDINVGMKHTIPPTVKKMKGYEEGINIRFDKYMKPATMTTSQMSVVTNGVNVVGTVRLLNEEEGYASDTAKYVSKVRFVPDQSFTVGDNVTVTVKSTVQSYAGMKMASDYSQVVEIEKEVKSITSDSLAEMKIHGNKTITVSVLPAAAAQGKTILANSASSSIVSLINTQAVLDSNGKATFSVNGDLPGGTTVQFTMSDVDDLSAITNVNVSLTTQVSAPSASITSGTLVPKDTTVTLTTSTSDAMIYYTTDGTPPSDVNGSRNVYSSAIQISKSMTIQAIAVKDGFDDSEVVRFTYLVDATQNVINVSSNIKSIKVYPNPAKSNNGFRLEIKAAEEDLKQAQLSILSVSGQVVLLKSDLKQKMLISGLPKGCYIIRVRLLNGDLLNTKLMVL